MLHSRPKVTTHLKPHEPEGFPLKTKTASLSDLLREAVLKGQCNMKNSLIVREVRGAMTQLEPLTAELFDAAHPGMSFTEFQDLLAEYGLSMEYIMHDSTRHFLSTIYADCQHGRYLELYLNSKYLRDTLRSLLAHFPKEGDTVQELATHNWGKYYSKCVPLPMLIHDFQLRYQDIPSAEVFSVWYAIHKRIDYANGMWRPEVLDYVLSHAPATELPAAGPDGLITLYRGMGSLSQPPKQALSWSSTPVSALWYAVHFARGTHIATTRVRPNQIVHYTPSHYNENEVLVRPGTVTEYSYEDMIPALEETVPKLLAPAIPDFWRYGQQAQRLGYRQEDEVWQVHGLLHILRVLLLSLIYFHNSGDTLTEADKQILIYFSLLHDLGRTTEERDDGHGDASVRLIHARGIRLKGIKLSPKDYRIAEQIIRFHCLDDQAGLDAIDSQPYLSRKEKERSKHLYRICKDMDGLDRIRFNGLDYRLLRTEYGRKLPLVAGCLLNEDLLKALQTGLDGK